MFVFPSPDPSQVKAARLSLGMTQTEFAQLILGSERAVQEYERGRRAMSPSAWRLVEQRLDFAGGKCPLCDRVHVADAA